MTTTATSPDLLLLIQACSLTVAALLAFMLVAVRFYQPQVSVNYEKSRWLLFTALLLAAVHYVLQIAFGIRAHSDDLGALVNILFYTPVAWLLTYSSLRLVSDRKHKVVYFWLAVVSIAFVIGCFLAGYIHYGSVEMPLALKAMEVEYFVSMLIYTLYSDKEIRRVKRMVENETGGDVRQFFSYMRTSVAMLYVLCLMMPFVIFSVKSLAIFGPVVLALVTLYILSFMALGFNLTPVSDIIDEEVDASPSEAQEEAPAVEEEGTAEPASTLSEQRSAEIRAAIERWRADKGYSQPDVNSVNLAEKLRVPKRQLIRYIQECEGKTFRVWLSELRIEEAKRMLIEDDNYKLETIAYACGFSHRSYLQNRFKAITGLTPREWQECHRPKPQ